MQPRIVLLKEGVDASQGKNQLISNINACEAVISILKTTLGPRGMDKLICDPKGKVTISNDGATLIGLLDIVHPAAKTLVDIARSQDAEVGDGTTSVCVLAGELLKSVKGFVEDGLHPQIIIKGYRKAAQVALARLQEIAVDISLVDNVTTNDELLIRCAETALNSKLISNSKGFFARMVVDAIRATDGDEKMIGVQKVAGGSVKESRLVNGVAFQKTFAYAGFDMQPKRFESPLIALLNVELELKAEKANLEIRLKDNAEYKKVVEAEWQIIYDKLQKIVDSGAKVILSRLPIGDLATQFFADRDIFCAGRVSPRDLERVSVATGGIIQTSLNDLSEEVLGKTGLFEEKGIGGERFNFFLDCPNKKACTIILRGGAEQFIAETHRSMHDALMIVKRCLTHKKVVGGGGAIEMELSRHLKEYAKGIRSKLQLVVTAFAQSLEIIPQQLCENAGFDATDVVNQLRYKHSSEDAKNRWFGVDINNADNGGICDTYESFVWEPALIKLNAISAATEAACMILSVDETVKNPKANAHGETSNQAVAGGRGNRR